MSVDIAKLPVFTLKAGSVLHRIHRAPDAPWFFNGSGTMRFDLPQPQGTCYLAEDALGAFVETIRTLNPVPQPELAHRRLTTVTVTALAGSRLADLTASRALAAGVTAALATGDPHGYDSSQALARACHAAGLAGIRYRVRHDPSQRLIGVALFGTSGIDEREAGMRTRTLPHELVQRAQRRFGCAILPAVL